MPSSNKLFRILAGLAAAAVGVQAGNRFFEPKLGIAPSAVFSSMVDGGDELSSSVAGNGSATLHNGTWARDDHIHGHLDRRWVSVDTKNQKRPGGMGLWPDKTIKFCFRDVDSKAKLHDHIVNGMQLWYTAGLDDAFEMKEVSDGICRDEKKRSNYMVVVYDKPRAEGGNSILSTTPGRPNGSPPSMTLTDDKTIGMLDVVSNIAHEIGHAWGLHHEHQNPHFWDTDHKGKDGTVFTAANWNCENLSDYQKALDSISAEISNPNRKKGFTVGQMEKHKQSMCTNRGIAKIWGFSAYEYLPLTDDGDDYLVGTEKKDAASVDWKSIMLYPSGAGGKSDGAGGRMPILKRPNGDPITPNMVPSHGDVAGLTALYGQQKASGDVLLVDKSSKSRLKFWQVRNKDTGVDCG